MFCRHVSRWCEVRASPSWRRRVSWRWAPCWGVSGPSKWPPCSKFSSPMSRGRRRNPRWWRAGTTWSVRCHHRHLALVLFVLWTRCFYKVLSIAVPVSPHTAPSMISNIVTKNVFNTPVPKWGKCSYPKQEFFFIISQSALSNGSVRNRQTVYSHFRTISFTVLHNLMIDCCAEMGNVIGKG